MQFFEPLEAVQNTSFKAKLEISKDKLQGKIRDIKRQAQAFETEIDDEEARLASQTKELKQDYEKKLQDKIEYEEKWDDLTREHARAVKQQTDKYRRLERIRKQMIEERKDISSVAAEMRDSENKLLPFVSLFSQTLILILKAYELRPRMPRILAPFGQNN